MKTFKKLVSEVAQPKSPEERAFKDQHIVQKFDYPVKDSDAIFKGTVEKKKRPADYDAASDKAAYDKATPEKPPFKMPRNVDESVEELDESVPAPVANPKHTANFSASKHGDDPGMRHGHEVGHMGPLHRAPAKLGATKARGHLKTADAHRAAAEKHKKLIDNARTDKSKVYHKRAMNAHNDAAEAHHNAHYSDAKHRDIHRAHHATNIANNLTRDAANKATKRKVTESEQINEGVMDKVHNIRRKVFGKTDAEKRAEAERNAMAGFHNAMKKASDGMTKKQKKEEVEQVDEISKDLAGRYIKKAQIDTADAADKVARSYDTYDKKQGEKQRKAGIAKIVRRRMGTHDAVSKLTGKARVAATEAYDEPASPDESSMAKKQAEFIQYVAKEIGDHLDANKEFPEWMQNKLSALHQSAKDYHSHLGAHGMDEDWPVKEAKKITAKDMKRALAGMKVKGKDEVSLKKAPWEKKEDVNEVTQSATKKMVNVTGPDGKVHTVMRKTKTTQYDDKGQEKIKTNEEAEQIDEISKDLAQRYYTKSYDAQRKAMSTMTDTEKSRKPEKKKAYADAKKTFLKRGKGSAMAAKRLAYKGKNEEVEYIDEAVKVGNMRLRDGSSVKVTKEDAKLLNQMFKDLNSANRRKMEQVMMTDKAGFEEIRGFAREAL